MEVEERKRRRRHQSLFFGEVVDGVADQFVEQLAHGGVVGRGLGQLGGASGQREQAAVKRVKELEEAIILATDMSWSDGWARKIAYKDLTKALKKEAK